MLLLNWLLLGLLTAEGVICVILILPFGGVTIKNTIQALDDALRPVRVYINTVRNVLLAMIVLVFASNLQTTWKFTYGDDGSSALSDGMRLRLLLSQRDVYFSGAALFLFMLLQLIYAHLKDNVRLQKSLEAMTKQAQSAADGYKAMLADSERLTAENKKMKEVIGEGEGEKALQTLLDNSRELENKVQEQEKALKRKDDEIEQIKKQSQSQGDAFKMMVDDREAMAKKVDSLNAMKESLEKEQHKSAELQKEAAALKKQLEDYEFMFADELKKKK